MSILIKGMEMPKNCKECYDKGICYHIHHIANCPLCGEIENPASYVLAGIKHPDCPLVPVPPHARIGDLDELKERVTKRLYASNHGSMAEAYFAALIDLIDTAPTVIEAEEGE